MMSESVSACAPTAKSVPITIAHGDGIGPEIMSAVLAVLDAAGAALDIEEIEIGEKVYKSGIPTGMSSSAFDSLKRTHVFLKAPITTPLGGGYKSLNVTTRKAFGLFANVRPCVSYHPFVSTKHPKLDVVIVRENEEDLYAGIEYRQTVDCVQGLKLMTRPACERIIQYAFDYARRYHRRKVTCFSKDNIMKLTDGLFHKTFLEIGEKYPDIEKDHRLIDIGTALLADSPEMFDVIVAPNLYGDIISDVAAQVAGSVGLAGSANIGTGCAMFEAIHGSAPTIAGQNIANPSGLLLAAVMMLVHIGQGAVAERIHNAWLRAIEDGVHTKDYHSDVSRLAAVGTKEFALAVIERLGSAPKIMSPVCYRASDAASPVMSEYHYTRPTETKTLVGVDVFVDLPDADVNAFAKRLQDLTPKLLRLSVIENRGIKIWPDGSVYSLCCDHWRCRFMGEGESLTHDAIVSLLSALAQSGIDFIQTENLYNFDGKPTYSVSLG